LPTIRSRCQLINFAALEPQLVQKALQSRGISSNDAIEAGNLAGGSIGLALKWIEDGVVGPARDLAANLDSLVAGRGGGDVAPWFKKAAEAYAEKQLERDKLSSKDQATREGLGLYLRLAAEHLRGKLPRETDPERLER